MFRLFFWENAWPHKLHTKGRSFLETGGGGNNQKVCVAIEEPAENQGSKHLWMALMCICRPFRLDARWPHSSQTNGFSPRCLAAWCTRSSVRVRKALGHSGHWRCRTSQQSVRVGNVLKGRVEDSPRVVWGDREPSSCGESDFSYA